MKKFKLGLLSKIIIAIILGVACDFVMPLGLIRIFSTFNSIFSEFLGFFIPLIIVGLVTPAISNIGRGAGKILLVTVVLAYIATLLAGLLSYGVSVSTFPSIIADNSAALYKEAQSAEPAPYFTMSIPPLMSVMTALILSFVLGLGIAYTNSEATKKVFDECGDIVTLVIKNVIIPLLPLYIFGIFLSMTETGQVAQILKVFAGIIGIIFLMHIFWLIALYTVAGVYAHKNPFVALKNMMPAYFTALGTQSSAATIPVTLAQTIKNGVTEGIAGFVIPLCATIHLSGSMLKIVACALALMIMQGNPYSLDLFIGFICMLGVTMVAAPGVPGGAIMAALGVLSSMLGFSNQDQALMIALYIAMDCFGTACNVTGDGALALIIDKMMNKENAPTA
ncbi:MAG: dicarboxylate/amino acid:cation symporter [Bacteroidaceae bacterium]|nr:dicarboxylate/amino acid:cation symporter [Bacteroidaceae bacterium]